MTDPITVTYEATIHYSAKEVEGYGITEEHARENILEMVMNNAGDGYITISRGDEW